VYYLQNPRQAVFPQRDIVLETSFGARLLCSHENHIERMLLNEGHFEPESTAATLRAVKPGDVAIDVGANVGYYSLLLAQCTGPNGQVHAFEPTRWAYERSLRNLALNKHSAATIVVNHAGLLAQERTGFEAIESRFSARILAKQTREQLRFLTLDRYCSERGIARIDFMKVDVDGYDYQVMCGAREILRNSHATLLCELHDRALSEHGNTLAEYIALLADLGYTRGEILDGPRQGTIELADLLAHGQQPSLNLLLQR
jgi:FkbM family methyltransferase